MESEVQQRWNEDLKILVKEKKSLKGEAEYPRK